jgi:dihydroorotate dehydrogenase
MIFRGINFGPVFDASGVRNFFGEGYPFHKITNPFGLSGDLFNGVTFVAKTTTLNKREGNMLMDSDGITPMQLFPSCVKANFRKGIVLNAVGLSGPGAEALFEDGRWQHDLSPFMISFMSVAETVEKRINELLDFIKLYKRYEYGFRPCHIGLQINYSCPNVEHELSSDDLVDEARQGLTLASELDIPLMLKFNALAPVGIVKVISEHESCDAICISNTIPWGKLPERIDWEGLFGTKTSPLANLGGGGLSGAPLLPIVRDWLIDARKIGITKHINAGGGILCPDDVNVLHKAGADSIFLGSIRMLRWWRMKNTIKRAHELF